MIFIINLIVPRTLSIDKDFPWKSIEQFPRNKSILLKVIVQNSFGCVKEFIFKIDFLNIKNII